LLAVSLPAILCEFHGFANIDLRLVVYRSAAHFIDNTIYAKSQQDSGADECKGIKPLWFKDNDYNKDVHDTAIAEVQVFLRKQLK